MANPFDQFDAPDAAIANPFDQFDVHASPVMSAQTAQPAKPAGHAGALAGGADDGALTGVAKSVGTAAIKGLSNSVGTVGNLGNFADYLLARGHSAVTGKPVDDVLADYAERRKLPRLHGAIDPSQVLPSGEDVAAPILSRTGEYVPDSSIGKMAQAGLETVFGMAGPGGGAAARTGPITAATTGTQALLRTPAVLAPVNFAAGATGQGVTDATGDPLLGMAAGIAGPVAGQIAGAAATRALKPVVRPFLEDMPIIGKRFAGEREQMAREELLRRAENPTDLADSLMVDQHGPLRTELVPGSKPTTGEFTGDRGMLEGQRQFAQEDAAMAGEGNRPFKNREVGQDAARRRALEGQGPGADVMKPSQLFQQQLDHIEQSGLEAVERLKSGALELARPLGPGQRPEANGVDIRSAQKAALDEARKARSALYRAVDPDGMINVVAGPLRDRIVAVAQGLDPYSAPLKGDEARIFGQVQSLPDVVPFKSLMALDSNIQAALMEERRLGQTPTWGRLSQAKSAVQEAISNAVDNQHAYEAAAVKAGTMSPADTIDARLREVHDGYGGHIGAGPANPEAVAGGNAGQGSAGLSEIRGSAGAGAGRSGDDASAARVSARAEPGAAQDLSDYQIYYPGGRLNARYEVVDHPSLVTSHDNNFSPNPAFPQHLQPRARESAPARDQVNGMAARLQPERLGPSPEANSGAPIVGPDNVVESGNGRTMAIGKAYARGDTSYRDWLEGQGFDTSGMKRPVLVARRTSDMTPSQREYFANSANSSASLKMSAAEQALSDAKLLSRDTLGTITAGSIKSAENRAFVRAFADKLPAAERGGMLDKGGELSQTGVRRIEAALAAKAFDDAAFVGRAFDSADSNIRNLAGALVDAAGPWARMREAARDGTIDASHDITGELMSVIHKVMRARDAGRPIAEVLRQNDMFGSDVAPLVESLLFSNPDAGALATRSRISSGLRNYAVEAEKNVAGPRLFGDDLKPQDVLKAAIAKKVPDEPVVVDAPPSHETGASEPVARGLTPNFDKSAADRLAAAKASHKDLAETFRNPTIKPVLATDGGEANFRMLPSAVPGKAVVAGAKGYEVAKAHIKAARNDDAAVNAMIDEALNPLRGKNLHPDGTISPKALTAWKENYAGVLKALDEVRPGFSKQFNNAGRATELMVNAGRVAKQRVDDFNASEAAKFLKVTTPVEAENAIGAVLTAKDGPRRMAELVQKIGDNKEALAGLQQAGVDWMMRKLSAVVENGTSGEKQIAAGTFQKFIRDNATTLGKLYPEQQVNAFRAISNDLERTSRYTTTMNKASPNTSKDLGVGMKKALDVASSNQSLFAAALTGLYAGWDTAGVKGAVLAGGLGASAYVVGKLRGAGISTVNDMVRDALLNPERARFYLAQLPKERLEIGPLYALTRSLRRSLLVAPTARDDENKSAASKYPARRN